MSFAAQPTRNPTFMELLVQQKVIDAPVFTVDFNPKLPGSKPEIEFGVISYNKASGPLAQAPVNSKPGWWTVDGITYSVNGKPLAAANGSTIASSMIFGSYQPSFNRKALSLTAYRCVQTLAHLRP